MKLISVGTGVPVASANEEKLGELKEANDKYSYSYRDHYF